MPSPLTAYDMACDSGQIQADSGQRHMMAQLEALYHRLLESVQTPSFWQRVVGQKAATPKGLYIYGGVGRGKTMLMDMFYQALPPAMAKRLHFHDFMVEAHDVMTSCRQKGGDDPVAEAASLLAAGPKILCFDEMEVRDIADAMILKRLFDALFAKGVTVVATSNRHPDELYLNGLHRDRFLPFIDQLKQACQVEAIADGQDWRTRLLAEMPRWFVPHNETTTSDMRHYFTRLAAGEACEAVTLKVAGRAVVFSEVASNIAFCDFADLCAVPLAARDYIAVADRFSGLFMTNVPILDDALQNEARRFMWLVDALYDRGRFFVASAEADMTALYTGRQWAFEFDRTLSRLSEMTRLDLTKTT